MPLEPKKIHMQFQMCTSTNDIVQYQVLNAFNQTSVHSGKIYSKDKYGITYVSPLTYMENEILFKLFVTGFLQIERTVVSGFWLTTFCLKTEQS